MQPDRPEPSPGATPGPDRTGQPDRPGGRGDAGGPAATVTPGSGDVELIEEALVRIVRRAKQRPAHDQLMRAAGLSMERAAFAVARLCEAGPVRLSDLAAKLDVNVSTISRHVQQLERDGLLRRSDDPRDRRAAILHLTAEGRRALERAGAARRAALVRMLDPWEPRDRQRFAELLTRFAQEFEKPLEPPARERPARWRHGGPGAHPAATASTHASKEDGG